MYWRALPRCRQKEPEDDCTRPDSGGGVSDLDERRCPASATWSPFGPVERGTACSISATKASTLASTPSLPSSPHSQASALVRQRESSMFTPKVRIHGLQGRVAHCCVPRRRLCPREKKKAPRRRLTKKKKCLGEGFVHEVFAGRGEFLDVDWRWADPLVGADLTPEALVHKKDTAHSDRLVDLSRGPMRQRYREWADLCFMSGRQAGRHTLSASTVVPRPPWITNASISWNKMSNGARSSSMKSRSRLSTSITPSILRRELLGREDRLEGSKGAPEGLCVYGHSDTPPIGDRVGVGARFRLGPSTSHFVRHGVVPFADVDEREAFVQV